MPQRDRLAVHRRSKDEIIGLPDPSVLGTYRFRPIPYNTGASERTTHSPVQTGDTVTRSLKRRER
jgi:hypothetical protein